jgi:hypothetical protein
MITGGTTTGGGTPTGGGGAGGGTRCARADVDASAKPSPKATATAFMPQRPAPGFAVCEGLEERRININSHEERSSAKSAPNAIG